MMRDPEQISELESTLFDIFMELESESKEAQEREATARSLRARRAIEEHFEKKRLRAALKNFDFDD